MPGKILKASFLLAFIFFILPISFAVSTTNFIVNEGQNALTLKVPLITNIKQGNNFNFDIHVFNSSNGAFITNNTTCYFHVYNSEGNHVLTSESNTTEYDFDYSFDLNSSYIKDEGEYYYNIQCKHNGQGGFFSSKFTVTETGVTQNKELILVGIFTLLGIILFVLALKYQDRNIAMLSGMLILIAGVYLFINGYLGVRNILQDTISLILVALGLYILLRSATEGAVEDMNWLG